MTSRPSLTARRQVFIYIPKIYEPLSDSESEEEVAEHYMMKMLFFPWVKRETNSNHFEDFFRTLSSCAVKLHCVDVALLNVDKKKVNHIEGLKPLLLFFPAYQFAIKDWYQTKNASEESFSSLTWRKLCYEVVMVVKVI